MKQFLDVMKALSDPNRVKIVKMLQHKGMCVCELQDALQISQSTVSKHLKILKHAGLVDFWKNGRWVNYHLADGIGSPYISTLMGYLKHWLEDNPEVKNLKARSNQIRRVNICRQ